MFVSDSFAVLQHALVTAVTTVKDADPLAPVTVLVPSTLLATRLRRVIAWAAAGHFGLRVCTLTDLARDAAEDALLQEGLRPLPPLADAVLVQHLLREAEADNYFAPLAALPGFPRTLLATLTDVRQAAVAPQRLRDFLARAPQGEVSRQKLTSFVVLYERYLEAVTAQGCYDVNGLLEQALPRLAAETPTAPLMLYGFYDFTPLQQRFVAAAVEGRDSLAFFPWRAGNAFAHATATLTWLANLGFQTAPLQAPHAREDALARLQAELFEERPRSRSAPLRKNDPSVRFLSSPGKSQEAREIGRLILDGVRTQGLRFHEVGVLLREPAAYGPLLVDTFRSLGIPCFLYGGAPLLQTPAGQRLLLLCRVLLEDYARSRVMEFLRGAEPPFAARLGELADAAHLTQWEAFSLQAGIVKGAQAWRDRLARLLANVRNEDLDAADEEEPLAADRLALRAFLTFVDGFLTASEIRFATQSWRAWSDFLIGLLRLYTSPTEHTEQLEETLLNLGELDGLGALAEPVSFAQWVNGAAEALQAATVPVGALDQDGVFVGDLLAARGLQFRVVVIPGLVDGAFPRLARQDPLLLDQERQYLSEFLACELRPRRGLNDAEHLLFVLAVQSAQEQVVFSYPRAEQNGEQIHTPSFYLLRAVETLTDATATFAELREWTHVTPLLPTVLGPPSDAIDLIEYHLLSAGHVQATGDPAPLGYLPEVSPFGAAAFRAAQQRWQVERLTSFEGMLESDDARARVQQSLFPAGLRLSASALETYARCPFRYFLTVVMGLLQWEEPENVFTLQPRARGALLHDILQDFFTRAREAGRLPLAGQEKAELRHFLQQVAEQHFDNFARLGATGFPLLWDIERERLHERLMRFLDREYEAGDDFFPAAFEVRFGASQPAEDERSARASLFPDGPVQFRLDDGELIALRGRIDRIDLSLDQQRARLVDYKTGKSISGQFAGGAALQLPLYLYAARSLWPEHAWESAAYAYVDGERKAGAPPFTASNWDVSLRTLQDIVTKLTSGLRRGCFPATPERCAPCPFPLVCGTTSRMARKTDDARLDFLRQVRAVA
jgi:ATP-dependent helicase/DNAse subunit B